MKTAQAIVKIDGAAKDKVNLATKGLGVLFENGPYGLVLYFETNAKKDIGRQFLTCLVDLCCLEELKSYLDITVPVKVNFQGITDWLRELASDIDRYLFIKHLWQQTLTYARYHAKAFVMGDPLKLGVDK